MDEPRKWSSLPRAKRWGIARKPPDPSKPRKPRKGLAHRSKTNSRPWENLPLQDEYREAFPICQTCAIIFGHLSKRILDAEQLHHLWAGNPRVDVWPNFVAVCGRCHGWLHHKDNINDGKVICLWVKLHLAEEDARHWNLEQMRVAARQRLQGWISRPDKQPNHEWVRMDYLPAVLKAIG